ncbi:TPA: hypothetical protein DCQ22_04010 [Candidatus Nomurabacteria bacterium]|nr:hypothetical protein [Candidatus Nomurabacteria bacterium]
MKEFQDDNRRKLEKVGILITSKSKESVKKNKASIPEPAPVSNDLPNVWDLVLQDMQARDVMGLQKYKTHLQPFNGRDPLWDAYQEALDLVVYLRQAIFEKEQYANQIKTSYESRVTALEATNNLKKGKNNGTI